MGSSYLGGFRGHHQEAGLLGSWAAGCSGAVCTCGLGGTGGPQGGSWLQSGKLVTRMFQKIQDLIDDKEALVFVLIDEVGTRSCCLLLWLASGLPRLLGCHWGLPPSPQCCRASSQPLAQPSPAQPHPTRQLQAQAVSTHGTRSIRGCWEMPGATP